MPEPRFLVLRLGSLGDIVHTFPAVAALRESVPNGEIVWLTHPRWKILVESSRLASEIRTIESRDLSSVRSMISGLRNSRWDVAIDYQGLWKSAALPFFGGVKRRIGFSSHTIREYGVPILYSERVKAATIHIADQNGELSRRAGSRKRVARVTLSISQRDEESARSQLQQAGIGSLHCAESRRRLAREMLAGGTIRRAVPEIRTSLGLRCVVNYGPGEDDLAAAVRAASGDAEPFFCNFELGPLMATLRAAACIVGGDTGPLHLAIALGTPAVASVRSD